MTADERRRVAADLAELTARLDQVVSGFQRRLNALAAQIERPVSPARDQRAVEQDTSLAAGVE